MRIGIDARGAGGGQRGGVEMFVLGLAQGFAGLTDGDERYHFLTTPGRSDWLEPFLGDNCALLPARAGPAGPGDGPLERLGRAAARLRDRAGAARNARRLRPPAGIPVSNGRIEAAGIDLMHFTMQAAFATALPSIYHPHDLQHRRFPEFFTPQEVARREHAYPYFCDRARMVATVSSWVKDDVTQAYGLPAGKVAVVPYAPPSLGYAVPTEDDLRAAAARLDLPPAFAFYPAQTWRHKNHIRLLEAAARIRADGGPAIPLVFSGRRNDHFPAIEARARELGLADDVRFLGFVDELDLQCLYRLARCLVMPSLHEAASFPIWEAFHAGAPVICSAVTSLPAQAGDAALLFDPEDVEDIARALARIWTDAPLRNALARRGRARVAAFDWDRACRLFRAHYRRILDRPLDAQDRALLAAPPML